MFQLRVRLTNLFLATVDLLITVSTFLVVFFSGQYNYGRVADSAPPEARVSLSLLYYILPIWSLSFTYFHLYRSQRTGSYWSDTVILLKGILLGTSILAVLKMFYAPLPLSNEFFSIFIACNFSCLAAFRLCMRLLLRQLRRRGINTKDLLIVGTGAVVDQIIDKIESHPFYGYRVVGVLRSGISGLLTPGVGRVEDFSKWIEKKTPDEVIIALPSDQTRTIKKLIETCEDKGVHARIALGVLDVAKSHSQVYSLGGIPLVNARIYPTERIDYVFLKRMFDLLVALSLLITLAPVLLLIGLLVKLSSPGPAMFRQERVGLNGKRFSMYKFRTMKATSPGESDTRWTGPQDERVTWVGRFLRKTGFDEVPQLLNVVHGDMSIVGPRPERPHYVEKFKQEIPHYMVRHYMKCGITGWAQVNGWRGDTSIRKRIEYDLYYMQNWAIEFDIKILLLTLTRGFFHRNAY